MLGKLEPDLTFFFFFLVERGWVEWWECVGYV